MNDTEFLEDLKKRCEGYIKQYETIDKNACPECNYDAKQVGAIGAYTTVIMAIDERLKESNRERLQHPAFLIPDNWCPVEWTTVGGVSVVLVEDKSRNTPLYAVFSVARGLEPEMLSDIYSIETFARQSYFGYIRFLKEFPDGCY